MPLSFADFVFATLDDFTTGDRTGEPTKVPPADTGNGMVPGAPVAAEDHNYLYNLIGLALTELKALPETALTWTLDHVFQRTLAIGGALSATFANALIARLQISVATSAVGSRTCWLDTSVAGTKLRGYVNVDGNGALALEFTLNAGFSNTDSLWHKDTAGIVAAILRFSREHVRVGFRPIGSGAWDTTFTDPVGAGWLLALGLTDDGAYTTGDWELPGSLTSDQVITGGVTADTVEATLVDAASVEATGVTTTNLALDGYLVRKELVPKAWALIHIADDVTGDVEIIDSSDNVTAVSLIGGGPTKEIRVEFSALLDTSFAPIVQVCEITDEGEKVGGGTPDEYHPIPTARTATYYQFFLRTDGDGGLDLGPPFTFDAMLSVIIMGRDT